MICNKCGLDKDESEFYKYRMSVEASQRLGIQNNKVRYISQCKECQKDAVNMKRLDMEPIEYYHKRKSEIEQELSKIKEKIRRHNN